jgi:hypothetical protein
MSVSAEEYYASLKAGSPSTDIVAWDREIEQAETDRLGDPRGEMMDVLLARHPDTSVGTSQLPRTDCTRPEEKWVQLGIDIQTRQ